MQAGSEGPGAQLPARQGPALAPAGVCQSPGHGPGFHPLPALCLSITAVPKADPLAFNPGTSPAGPTRKGLGELCLQDFPSPITMPLGLLRRG